MKHAGTGWHARAGIVASLLAALALAACLEAYVTHLVPPHVQHEQWIKVERVAAPDAAIPIALMAAPSTVVQGQPVGSAFVLASEFRTPLQPYRSTPAAARAPPAPLDFVL